MLGGSSYYSTSHHHHHHYPNHHHKAVPHPSVGSLSPESAHATEIFEHFIVATTFKSVLHYYQQMCDVLKLRPINIRQFYPKLKNKIRSWKAQALWSKFDKRAAHKCYNHGKACNETKVLIIGAGPCGLRSAIEAQLLGAKVVVIEKRDRFSRNNVLHLWPFVIADLKALGAKKFYGKFCAGAIDHISIRQIQCILLKIALLLGVEVFEGVTFEELLEPPEDQSQRIGWHANFSPAEHPVNQYEFDVLIGADGKRNTLIGFKRKEFRGKLAIAITANFINRRTELEARVQEISGVAFIFNQKFFKDLYAATGIDLENIVYYKDETHYFVMTAKKHSLINKGVILRDLPDTQLLLHSSNVDRKALGDYAREAADFSTGYQLPHLDFAVNHYGKSDIAMFDFTSMFAAENACRVIEKKGHKLLQCLVGDSLLEPFWPTGSGCARGFLSSFDAAWAIRSWSATNMNSLEVIAERESIYRLLAQTTPENLSKDYSSYSLDPASRYPTVNLKVLLPFQVRHFRVTDESVAHTLDSELLNTDEGDDLPRKRKRRDSLLHPETLLSWCQKQVVQHTEITVDNLSTSFKDGRVLCAIIHRYRPDLIDYDSLKGEDEAHNNQLAIDILEREFNIQKSFTGAEVAAVLVEEPSFASYVSQVYDIFRGEIPQSMGMVPLLRPISGQHLDLDDFPIQCRSTETESSLTGSTVSSQCSLSGSGDGRISCKILDKPNLDVALIENAQKCKKRRNEIGTLDANAYQRHQDIERNKAERYRKQREQRELNTVRFIRSMKMLHCDLPSASCHSSILPSFRQSEDQGLIEYRKHCVRSMRERAAELERKIYFPDKLDSEVDKLTCARPRSDPTDEFTGRVRGLEGKFKGETSPRHLQKPKDMIRAVGRLEKTDWNLCAIEKKIEDSSKTQVNKDDREKVPKWSKDLYNDKFQNIERRLRENGEDEERIAKYLDIDASLKRLERKLREGSTLETGLRGHNKVSNLASQLSSKLVRRDEDKTTTVSKQARMVILPSSGSDLCYFCGTRVYLVERLSAEGKFFHRQCFKCDFCGTLLRLGNYIYDREHRFGGKFYCIPHFGLTVRSRATKTIDETPQLEETRPRIQKDYYFGRNADIITPSGEKFSQSGVSERESNVGVAVLLTPPFSKDISPLTPLEDRGTTPERVEFENTVIEHSDEEEYLSEEEWTDRNFGASANELDDDDADDDSDYSDLSDEEIDMDELETSHQLTADETRRLAESWKRRYSSDVLGGSDRESLSDSELDNLSEEHGAEGDESHTATDDEGRDKDVDEDEDDDEVRRARELRRLEFHINFEAPPRKAETSDSGSETEVASDEDSDTQIDTDSEFAEDTGADKTHSKIPTIVVDELNDDACPNGPDEQMEEGEPAFQKDIKNKINEKAQERPKNSCDLETIDTRLGNENTERCSSLSNVTQSNQPNPRTEQLKRLLQRTESVEAVAAYKLNLKKEYLLGSTPDVPKKSVSTADLGSRFKSFMDKISETQKKLNPAPEPSPAMLAFLNSSKCNTLTLSPAKPATSLIGSYVPQLPSRSLSHYSSSFVVQTENAETISPPSESGSDSTKSEEGQLFSFTARINPTEANTQCLTHTKHVPSEYQLPGFQKQTVESDVLLSVMQRDLVVDLGDDTGSGGCVDAKNEYIIESCEPNSCSDNIENLKEDTIANVYLLEDSNLVYDKYMKPGSDKETDDALDAIVNKNIKNVCNDAVHIFNDTDIDECFDRLANDAMIGLSELKSSSQTLPTSDIDVESYRLSDDVECGIFRVSSVDIDLNCRTEKEISGENTEDKKQAGNCASSCEENTDDQMNFFKLEKLVFPNSPKEKCEQEIQSENVNAGCDLSDRDDDSDVQGQELDDLMREIKQPSPSGLSKARMASLESLEDSDSSKSFNTKKNYALAADQSSSLLKELASLDYMDSSHSESSLEDTSPAPFRYNKLQDETPATTPSTPVADGIALSNEPLSVSLVSADGNRPFGPLVGTLSHAGYAFPDAGASGPSFTSSPISHSTCDLIASNVNSPVSSFSSTPGSRVLSADSSSVSPIVTCGLLPYTVILEPNNLCSPSGNSEASSAVSNFGPHTLHSDIHTRREEKPLKNFKSKSLETEESVCEGDSLSQFLSEPHIITDKTDNEDSSSKASITQRYEGYIPRFKEWVTPFSLVRDSIDVRKSDCKPLFTPSREDILHRQKNEKERFQQLSSSPDSSGPSLISPETDFPPATSVKHNTSVIRRPKDGDVVRAMVMSRIPKKTSDKVTRRGSRNTFQLLVSSSASQLCASEPSLNKAVSSAHTASDSATCSKANIASDSYNKQDIKEVVNKIKVPSLSNQSESEVPKRTGIKTPATNVREVKVVPLQNSLPATPLTHPEQFQREIYKSAPHLNSLSNIIPLKSLSPPLKLPARSPYLSCENFNFSCSLIPPTKDPSSESHIRSQSSSSLSAMEEINAAVGEARGERPFSGAQEGGASNVSIEKTKKDPDERLKELLAERRRKETEEQREVRLRSKITNLQECLEEYRQKRNSAPIPQDCLVLKDAKSNECYNPAAFGQSKRQLSRPTLLELESMQVFLSSSKDSSFRDNHGSAQLLAQPKAPIVPANHSSSVRTTADVPHSTISKPSTTAVSEISTIPPKPSKNSKDRERRRSLIQVFAGMFSKSDEKKKSLDEPDVNVSWNESNSCVSQSSSLVQSVSDAPKSPSVRERFSKLRLSRSKDKKKVKQGDKIRSSSIGTPDMITEGSGGDSNVPSSVSLPTSPSRTIFSFLSSPSVRFERKKPSAGSGPSFQHCSQLYYSSCIQEENGSEDETMTQPIASDKEASVPFSSTPSTRKKKAVLRAAKQAEQKRLRMAQEIQRQLEECDVMTRELEEKGIKIEKALTEEKDGSTCDEAALMKEWFQLVREKNDLVRWQEELTVKAKELELEDRHVRLETELRERMTCSELEKTREDIDREGYILAEIISIIEQKDSLVSHLDGERQRYLEEDRELEEVEARKRRQHRCTVERETGV